MWISIRAHVFRCEAAAWKKYLSITNASGKNAYPIASFTWLLIPAKIQDPAKKKAITEFLQWALADGQKMVEGLSYARLPEEVIAMEKKALGQIQ